MAFALTAMSLGNFALSDTAAAQTTPQQSDRWEFRASSGALVPTGPARSALKDAVFSSAQLSYLPLPSLAITGTVGWARTRDRITEGQPKLDAFLYDLGIEMRLPPAFVNKSLSLAPFVGAGAGAQSYNYRSLNVNATHNVAAYGTIGGETGVRRVRIRLEVRDYVAGFKPLSGVGESKTHNDVVFMAAFRFAGRSNR